MIRFTQGTFSKRIQRSKPFWLMSKKKADCLFIVITIRRENLNCSFNSLELEHVHSSCLPKIKKKPTKKENDVFVESNGYFSADSKAFFSL